MVGQQPPLHRGYS